jgi:hypothetical protein
VAYDLATAAGTREIAFATVLSTEPLVLEIESRRIGDGDRIVLLHVNDVPCVEAGTVSVDFSTKSNFKIDGLSIGPLTREGLDDSWAPELLEWLPNCEPAVAPGDELIVADFHWFSDLKGNWLLPVKRPSADDVNAPKPGCTVDSYAEDPDNHGYCCRPHEAAEADWADQLAERRARGELNPQKWPPVRDEDAFEVTAADAAVGDPTAVAPEPVPEGLTIDDLE